MPGESTDTQSQGDVRALAEAFELFTETTRTMEEAYRRLESRIQELTEELAEKNRELEFTRDYLAYILEGISDGVIAVDTNETITAFNHAASAVLGYRAEDVVGQPFRERFNRPFSADGASGATVVELRSRDGKDIPVSERDSPLTDGDGNRIGTVKVFQDLSEIEALRERVRRRDRLAALGEMAATVAHEIRNPLGGLRGFASLLAQDIEKDDPRSRLVEKILEGAAGLDQVVTGLLEYTRPVEARLRPVTCKELVDATVPYIQGNGVAVRFEGDGGLACMADADKMRQVLLNVLLNAAQSMDGTGEIRVESGIDGDAVVISIVDAGCGIAEDALEDVFTPFYTTKEKGTGLGLATAQKIVESHGGAITAESAPGEGATFRIRLPRAD